MKKDSYRHGDVLIVPVKAIPADAKKKDHLVLAEGEQTGHSHQIIEGAAALFEFDEKAYLSVQDEIAVLSHEEHSALQLPKDYFEVIIQREYSPEGWRYVAD